MGLHSFIIIYQMIMSPVSVWGYLRIPEAEEELEIAGLSGLLQTAFCSSYIFCGLDKIMKRK